VGRVRTNPGKEKRELLSAIVWFDFAVAPLIIEHFDGSILSIWHDCSGVGRWSLVGELVV
jgi:hypothetical protein